VELDNLQHRFPGLLSNALNSLMVMVAGQLGKLVAPADLAARIGDYTFAYLLTGKTADEVRQLGQMLSHSVISRIFDVEGHSLTFGCSIGIAISRDTLASGLPLYSLALKACEDARKAGLNRVSVRVLDRENAGLQSSEQRRLLTLMQSALDKGGFQLVYQPIASLRGRAVEKYEVLLRLDDEDRNAVPPSRFVPLAEEKGLMEAIDRWIIEQTAQTLQHRGSSARFFVKVSLNTLKAMDFLPFLEHCLARYDASGEQLVFEISAAGINDGIRDAAEFARQVVRCKCAVSAELHDINQDVSQLIEYIPASYVKLTGTTVADLGSDPIMQARLKTVVEQARRGNAMVIAGFVEDAGCLQLLWQSGVHYIQGNFLQEPNELLDFDFG
jgi:EAL domain-containing protein (putative c-di-GMP-specific phosphodiesterase class I)